MSYGDQDHYPERQKFSHDPLLSRLPHHPKADGKLANVMRQFTVCFRVMWKSAQEGIMRKLLTFGIVILVSVTHRGKPPAPPGDSPRFDLYDGPREFLISAKRKEIHDERVPEPEPYEMGLQISRGVYSEATEEAGD